MCRSKYSPYESDWWSWVPAQSDGDSWLATPVICSEQPHQMPAILTQAELARDVSNAIHDASEDLVSGWFWAIIPYEAGAGRW